MATIYHCTECGAHFTDHEAFCENWRDPQRSFGCPRCRTLFAKKDITPALYRRASTIYSAGVFAPAVTLGFDFLSKGDTSALVYLVPIFVASSVIIFLFSRFVGTQQGRCVVLEKIQT